MSKKIIIVGGGPGGYVAAIRGAQLGAEVQLVEKESLGGTCLNVGCIPTKVLLHTAEFYHKAVTSAVAGVKSGAELDWPAAIERKEAVVKQLTGGVSFLLKNKGIQVHKGSAKLLPGLCVQVGEESFSADAIVLAVGSVNTALSFPGNDLEGIISSTEALSLQAPPKSIAIVGGGVIGIEFATLFAQLGAEVSVVEMMPEILPEIDAEIAALLKRKLRKLGIKIYVDARLAGAEKEGDGLKATVTTKKGQEEISAEKLLVATGRRPNTAGLGLEELGLISGRGAVMVDDNYQTSISGLYAVGDCNAQRMLAHAAMDQGLAAVEHIMGAGGRAAQKNIPSCLYTSPEIASVGMTEKQLQEQEIPYAAGRFRLGGNGKALIEGEDGMIKILADKEYGQVLGVHMIGPKVTEMIAESVLCMNMEGTVEDIVRSVHAHPTVSESVAEAAMAVFGKAIHST